MRPRPPLQGVLEELCRTFGATKKGLAAWESMAQRMSGEASKSGTKLLQKARDFAQNYAKQRVSTATSTLLSATPDIRVDGVSRDVHFSWGRYLDARECGGVMRAHKSCNAVTRSEGARETGNQSNSESWGDLRKKASRRGRKEEEVPAAASPGGRAPTDT